METTAKPRLVIRRLHMAQEMLPQEHMTALNYPGGRGTTWREPGCHPIAAVHLARLLAVLLPPKVTPLYKTTRLANRDQ